MEITGKVHCFFEQSGTFKNEFRKLGFQAEDYDIQNEFGETDHVIDLFAEIDKAYEALRQDKTRQDKTRQVCSILFLPVKTLLLRSFRAFTLKQSSSLILRLCGTEHLIKALQSVSNTHLTGLKNGRDFTNCFISSLQSATKRKYG
jgi:hypothetical protein